MKEYDVIIVGAGASGLVASSRAGELGLNVLVLEKMERPGRKILITGKGRCNITNDAGMAEFITHIHPNGKFLRHTFSLFFSTHIINKFHELGLNTVTERGGRIFPESNKASDVLNALLKWCSRKNVEIKNHTKVNEILISEGKAIGVQANINGEETIIYSKKVIICTGGNSYPATGSSGDGYRIAAKLGHTIEHVRPSLVPLETEGNVAQNLQGLSLKNVKATVWVNNRKHVEDFGEMLFTHFGLSGPIILTISRYVVDELYNKNKVEISIDLKPALDEQKLDNRLIRDINEHGKMQIGNIFKEWLPSKMIPVFLGILQIVPERECHQITSKERKRILHLLKDFRFTVKGHRSFKESIITAGGICLEEIDPKTLESRLIPNLYFAGEVLDCDADTGGYNLQIAYSTGWMAAQSCFDSLKK